MCINTQYIDGTIELKLTFNAYAADHDMRLAFLAQNTLKACIEGLRINDSDMPGAVSPSIEAERTEKIEVLQALLHAFDAVHSCRDAHVSTTEAELLANGNQNKKEN